MLGAGCLREPPGLRGEAEADGRDLAGTVETAVGDAHGKGDGTRARAHGHSHELLAASRMGFRPDSPRPQGLQHAPAAPGPPPPPATPSAPTREALLQAHQRLTQKPLFLQNPARRFRSEEAAPASGFMSGEGDAEFEMECFKTISPA